MSYQRILFLFLAIITVMVGCQTAPLEHQTDRNIADAMQRTKDAREKSDAAINEASPLLVKSGLYVDRTPINLAKEPSWLKSKIILRGGELPFSYYSRTITLGTGHIMIHYEMGVDPTILTTMNYTGSVRGALDMLATKTGYTYEINGNNIRWKAYVTRTFDVAFMSGSTDFAMGTSGASAGGGGSGLSSSLKGNASVWSDLHDAVSSLLSPQGKVMVSQATTSITVRDKPSNVALVARYMENFNKTLSKQVLVKVQVLDVQLNSAFNYGINWNLVQGAFGGSNFAFTGDYSNPVSIATTLTGGAIPQFGLSPNAGRTTMFQMLINALKQQGKVSVVTEPRVVCLNNQVSVINLVSKQGYAQSVANTSLASGGAGGSSVTTTITPGTVITGLVLYVLPKIMGDKVYLQVNADLSTLVGITQFTSGQGTANAASIQIPQTTEKEFNQRSVIASGDTLILAGFRQIQNTSNAMQLFDSQALGGKGAQQLANETVVLITPVVLNGTA